jgi:hypothetical protein
LSILITASAQPVWPRPLTDAPKNKGFHCEIPVKVLY